MYADAEARKKELLAKNEMQGLMFKMENDPRITKVGRFIRKTSIDELPQFFNVLKGDMSLVGTRPPTEDEFLQYKGRHKRRLSLKPGITGLWQVSGRSEIVDFEDVVRLDLEYIDHWSLLQDIKLLFKTVFVVVFRVGAK
jgi:lipopolysaccharide/colanic/teichoic acid biosynthesis glycosyltransferase